MEGMDYKPNSHKYKNEQKNAEERQKLDKVVKGTVKTKKRSELRKFTDVFIAEDIKSVKSYVFMDVLIPALKKAISEVVTNGIDILLYGDTQKSRDRGRTSASYVSYRDYSRKDDRRDREVRTRSGYSIDDIILESRGEAEEVLTRMDELMETYGNVSVADLYDLVGKTCQYTDNKYGWTNLRNAEPIRVRDGYMLKLPKVGPID